MAIGFLVFTNSMGMPLDNMGVMTMKMISITSITSTIGVTFISAMVPAPRRLILAFSSWSTSIVFPPWPLSGPASWRAPPGELFAGSRAALRALQEVVDQLGTGVAHFHVERFNLPGEKVEHPHRRDGHEQTQRRGDQGFGNTAGHRADSSGLLVRDFLKSIDDANDRPKQTHKWSGGPDGRQTADAALQLGVNDGFGAL